MSSVSHSGILHFVRSRRVFLNTELQRGCRETVSVPALNCHPERIGTSRRRKHIWGGGAWWNPRLCLVCPLSSSYLQPSNSPVVTSIPNVLLVARTDLDLTPYSKQKKSMTTPQNLNRIRRFWRAFCTVVFFFVEYVGSFQLFGDTRAERFSIDIGFSLSLEADRRLIIRTPFNWQINKGGERRTAVISRMFYGWQLTYARLLWGHSLRFPVLPTFTKVIFLNVSLK